jgi:hypothetical protein
LRRLSFFYFSPFFRSFFIHVVFCSTCSLGVHIVAFLLILRFHGLLHASFPPVRLFVGLSWSPGSGCIRYETASSKSGYKKWNGLPWAPASQRNTELPYLANRRGSTPVREGLRPWISCFVHASVRPCVRACAWDSRSRREWECRLRSYGRWNSEW